MEILIKNIAIATQNKNREIITRGFLLIKNNIIKNIGYSAEPKKISNKTKIIDGAGLLVIPGLINTHVHLGETIFKLLLSKQKYFISDYLNETDKIAQKTDLIEKNRQLICDYTASLLIKNGTSTIAGGRTSDTGERWGLRNASGYMVMNSPKLKKYSQNLKNQFDDYYAKIHTSQLSNPVIFIHSPETLPSIKSLQEISDIVKKYPDTKIMIHISETKAERSIIKKRWNKYPIQALDEAYLLNKNTILVHGNWLTQQELILIKKRNTSLVHCLSSNINSSDGTLDINKVIALKIPLAIATDGIVTAGSIDLLRETGIVSSYHNKFKNTKINPSKIFDAITIDAAKILGLGSEIGSIEIGKKADLAFLDITTGIIGLKNTIKDIICYSNSGSINGLMIDGKIKLWDKKIISSPVSLKKLNKNFIELGNKINKKINLLS